jgi:hypothetical protein
VLSTISLQINPLVFRTLSRNKNVSTLRWTWCRVHTAFSHWRYLTAAMADCEQNDRGAFTRDAFRVHTCRAACPSRECTPVADTTASLWGLPLTAAGLLPGLACRRSRTAAQPASRRSVRRRGRPAGSAAARSASLQRGRAGRRPARSAACGLAACWVIRAGCAARRRGAAAYATHNGHTNGEHQQPASRDAIASPW